jgi:sec-independent protein translocase protein TatC
MATTSENKQETPTFTLKAPGWFVGLLPHLKELRNRIMVCAIVIVVTTGIAFSFPHYIFEALLSRSAPDITFIYTNVTDMAFTYAKVSLYFGLAMASPVILYEVLMFVQPALTSRERRWLYLVLPMVLVLFVVGVLYAYYIFIPPSLYVLISYHWVPEIGTKILPMINIGSYMSFVVRAIFWIGVFFELPAIIFLLAKMGLVTHKLLASHWRGILMLIVIFGALITPTGNPVNQNFHDIIWIDTGFIVSLPVLGLYLLSIGLAWLGRKPRDASLVVIPAKG